MGLYCVVPLFTFSCNLWGDQVQTSQVLIQSEARARTRWRYEGASSCDQSYRQGACRSSPTRLPTLGLPPQPVTRGPRSSSPVRRLLKNSNMQGQRQPQPQSHPHSNPQAHGQPHPHSHPQTSQQQQLQSRSAGELWSGLFHCTNPNGQCQSEVKKRKSEKRERANPWLQDFR